MPVEAAKGLYGLVWSSFSSSIKTQQSTNLTNVMQGGIMVAKRYQEKQHE